MCLCENVEFLPNFFHEVQTHLPFEAIIFHDSTKINMIWKFHLEYLLPVETYRNFYTISLLQSVTSQYNFRMRPGCVLNSWTGSTQQLRTQSAHLSGSWTSEAMSFSFCCGLWGRSFPSRIHFCCGNLEQFKKNIRYLITIWTTCQWMPFL